MIDKLGKYIWNLLIAIDQLANAILWGDPDETLSSRMGKGLKTDCLLCKPVCFFLDLIDPKHCHKSIEEDEGKDEIR